MSALAHGAGRQGAAVALAAWAGIEPMPEDVRGLWLQVLLTGLDDAAYEALKAVMNLEKFRTQTPFYKEGRAEGRVEGRVEGEARTILVVLEARGLVVTDAQRAAIEAVRESARLDAMARKAATATSVDELFAE